MRLDPEIAAVLEAQRGLPPRDSLTVGQTRERMRAQAALAGPPLPVERVEDLATPSGVRIRQYWPDEARDLPLVVFFHGGRFFSGDLESHDPLCRQLAVASGCRVAAVEYRLAPEHRFPAAVEDACAAVTWALHSAKRVAVAGDSAGANLAAVAASLFRSGALGAQLLIYPMIDATCSSASYAEFATGYGPGAQDMWRGWREYLPEGHDPRDPLASPVFSPDLQGLAPAFVLTAEYDTLRDEAESYAARLRDAGVEVRLTRYDGMIHGFVQMTGAVACARRALQDCGAFLREGLR